MKKQRKPYIYILILIILIMQLFDSYCTDLFGKLQSFLLSDFLMDGGGMHLQDAVSYMGYVSLPFYAIPVLAPLARILIDKIGIKPIFVANIIILIAGCFLCAFAPSLFIYLIGNGLVIFSTSMDIQYIYIAEDVPNNRRATVRGIAAGVAAAATMLIPLFRSFFVDQRGESWRSLYRIALGMGALTVLVSFLLRGNKKKQANIHITETEITEEQRTQKNCVTENADTIIDTKNNKEAIRSFYICLFLFGIATTGITAYNEPLLAFGDASECQIRDVLLIQPAVTFIINIASGYLADKINRKTVILTDMLLSAVALLTYVISIVLGHTGAVCGIAWGFMIGCYFSAANLMILTVLEYADRKRIGRISAASNYANASGNAIGLLFCTVFVKYTGMGAVKLLSAIPVILLAFIYLKQRNPFENNPKDS